MSGILSGAISPDAMHVRFHNDKSRKDEFHLGNWGSVHVERVHEYWREHFTPFDVGYGVHALTDGYWVPSVKGDFPDLVDPARDVLIPALYYNDVRQTDFRLYAEHPDRPRIFALLRAATPPEDHPCSPPPSFPSGGTTSLRFMRAPSHDAPVRHVDVAYVERFIKRMVPELDRINEEVFFMTNAVLQAIADRRSNRGYAPRQLTEEELGRSSPPPCRRPAPATRSRGTSPWCRTPRF